MNWETFNIGSMNKNWPDKIKKLLVKGNVLDICCGNGRFAGLFDDYVGIDISNNLIKEARQLYPNKEFICSDIAKWKDERKFDNIFTWVSLQHVKPSDIEQVTSMMKQKSNNIIMCERLYDPEPNNSDYLWAHNYKKLFEGLKIIESISGEVHLMHWRNNVRSS